MLIPQVHHGRLGQGDEPPAGCLLVLPASAGVREPGKHLRKEDRTAAQQGGAQHREMAGLAVGWAAGGGRVGVHPWVDGGRCLKESEVGGASRKVRWAVPQGK